MNDNEYRWYVDNLWIEDKEIKEIKSPTFAALKKKSKYGTFFRYYKFICDYASFDYFSVSCQMFHFSFDRQKS